MKPVIRISNWDAIQAPNGAITLIIPPIPSPRSVELRGKEICIQTAGLPVVLVSSNKIAKIISSLSFVLIAEADERTVRETLAGVMIIHGKEKKNGQQAA